MAPPPRRDNLIGKSIERGGRERDSDRGEERGLGGRGMGRVRR